MLGREKRGKGLDKGETKQDCKLLHKNITTPKGFGQGIIKLEVRCLAHRGGVKCISELIFKKTYGVLKIFLDNIIHDVMTYTGQASREEDDFYRITS
ncbi:Histone H [Parasponia andersonii]|uniref:Histone H n=1 Tax=Parasponia andersonii TaxID=3476 RepID=A0A2P5BL56_PARAD|nr:Histone H [Parasponia andersonii]